MTQGLRLPDDLDPLQREFLSRTRDFGMRWESAISNTYISLNISGSTLFDGGAAHGLHTSNFAHFGGPASCVIAVEANPVLVEHLEALKLKRGWKCVEIHGVALADEPGLRTFHVATNVGHSSLTRHAWIDKDAVAISVEAKTIDQIVGSRDVRFVKLDLEGGEFGAVRGAVETIARARPSFILECGYEGSLRALGIEPSDYFGFWAGQGYEIVDLSGIVLDEPTFMMTELRHHLAGYIFALPIGSPDSDIIKASIRPALGKALSKYPATA